MLTTILMTALEIVSINGQAHRCEPGTGVMMTMLEQQIANNQSTARHNRRQLVRQNNQTLNAVRNHLQQTQCMTEGTFQAQLRAERQEQRRAERHAQRAQRRHNQTRYADFVAALEREDFDSHRLSFIQTALPKTCMRTADAEAILRTFDFDSNRSRALALIADQISDKENRFVLKDAFDFSSNGNHAMAVVRDSRQPRMC